jgi:hypothetical protein
MKSNYSNFFTELEKIQLPKPYEILKNILLITLTLLILILVLTYWRQTAPGIGYLTAFDPANRAQEIHATVNGRVKEWFVRDGSFVKAGDKIVEIVDNDPLILSRLEAEKSAKTRKLEAAKIASETSLINYHRQEELFKQGLSSRKNLEDAKIEYKKLLSALESANVEVAEVSTKLSRQESQVIYAFKDGLIIDLLSGNNSTLVKAGEKIAIFAPSLTEPAAELYISGNDIPLVYPGRKVRLQFEGWPAIQFSGWPEIAVGTFGGIVKTVDSSVSQNGKFRVLVVADENEKWPDVKFLRHGTKVYGWILLNQVRLGYELWRQINGFPASFDKAIDPQSSQKITNSSKSESKKSQ